MAATPVYPWRPANRFRLITEPEAFFSAMLRAIEDAQHEILLEMYLVESGRVMERFMDALARAASRGAVVRLLFDDFGARGLSVADRVRIRGSGIQLLFYNPIRRRKWRLNLHRDHRKLLLVDRRIGFTGGAALSDQLLPAKAGANGWRETMLEMKGPVLDDWASLFEDTWRKYAPVAAPHLPSLGAAPAGKSRGRVVQSRGAHRPEILRSFLQRTRAAEKRVWISTPYFIPSHRLRRSFIQAARRGCDVRLLVPGRITDHPGVRFASRRYFGKLLRAGVRIYEFRPCFLHSKALLCDDWSSLGSSNLDRWNQFWNLDANQEVDDPEFSQRVAAMFRNDFRHARRIDPESWRRRPLSRRFQERFWGLVERWLFRLSGRGLRRSRKRRRR
ncbi:MAG: phosphatidylserine/phosphatidylglycerophosphate/c ardiolipin synthase family protein [Gammaproteobacteria bacterium]